MHSEVDLVRPIDQSSLTQLYNVLSHRFSKRTCYDAEPRDIKSGDFCYWAPVPFGHSHSHSVLGVRVEAFDGTVAVCVDDFLEDFLSLDFHADAVLDLVAQVLVGQVYEAIVEF